MGRFARPPLYSNYNINRGQNMDNALKAWLILGTLVVAGVLGWYMIDERDDKIKQAVWDVCTYTRTTDAKETSCAMVQDATNSEYLCRDNNSFKTNVCWVELKD